MAEVKLVVNVDRRQLTALVQQIRALDGTRLNFTANGARQGLDGAARSANSLSKALQAAGGAVIWTGISAAVNGIERGVRGALDEIRRMDSALVGVQRASGMAENELKSLTDETFRLSSEYGRSVSGLMESNKLFAQAGIDNISQMTELSALLQNVGDLTADDAAKFLIASDAAWKLGGDFNSLLEIVDGLNELTNNAAVNMGDLTSAIRVSGSALAAHGETAQTFAAMVGTAAAATQRSGSEIGRALRTIDMRVHSIRGTTEDGEIIDTDALNKAGKALDAIGISIQRQDGSLKSTSAILSEVSDKWQTLSDAQRAVTVEGIAGSNQSNVAVALLENWTEYERQVKTFADGAGSALRENEAYLTSWDAKVERLSASWTQFVAGLTSVDAIKGSLDRITDFLDGANNLISGATTQEDRLPQLSDYRETTQELQRQNAELARKNALLNAASATGASAAYVNQLEREKAAIEEEISLIAARNRQQAEATAADAEELLTRPRSMMQGQFVDQSLLETTRQLVEMKRAGEDVDSELSGDIQTLRDVADALDEVERNGESLTRTQQKLRDEAKSVAGAFDDLQKSISESEARTNSFLDGPAPGAQAGEAAAEAWDKAAASLGEYQARSAEDPFSELNMGSAEDFLASIFRQADAMGEIRNAAGELVLSLSMVGDEAQITQIDIDALAEHTGHSAETIMAALTSWGALSGELVMTREDVVNLASELDALADAAGNAERVDASKLLEGYQEAGHSADEVRKLYDALKGFGDVDFLTNLPETFEAFREGLREAEAAAEELDGAEAEVSVKTDAEQAKEELEQAGDAAEKLDGKAAAVEAKADAGKAKAELDEVQAKAEAADGKAATVKVDADTSGAEGKLQNVEGEAQTIEQTSAAPSVGLDTEEFDAGAQRVKSEMEAMDAATATPSVDLDTSKFEAGVAQVESRLASLNGRSATTTVYVEQVYSSSGGGSGSGGSFGGRGGFGGSAHAGGVESSPGELALVNDGDGPELIREGDRARIAGDGEPVVTRLAPGAKVYTAEETRKIFERARRGGDLVLPAFAGGLQPISAPRIRLGTSSSSSGGAASRGGYAGSSSAAAAERTYGSGEDALEAIQEISILSQRKGAAGLVFERNGTGVKSSGSSEDPKLKSLEQIVSLREAELKLLEKQNAGTEVQADKIREIVAGLKDEVDYLSKGTAQTGIRLSLEQQRSAIQADLADLTAQETENLEQQKRVADNLYPILGKMGFSYEKVSELAGVYTGQQAEISIENQTKIAELQAKILDYERQLEQLEVDRLERTVSLRKSELDLMEAEAEARKSLGIEAEAEGAKLEDRLAKMGEIQAAIHEEAEALRQTWDYLQGDEETLEKVNGLSRDWLNIEKEKAELLKSEAETLRSEILEAQERLVSGWQRVAGFQESALELLKAYGAGDDAVLAKLGDMRDAVAAQLEAMQETGAAIDEQIPLALQVLEIREQELDIQGKLANGERIRTAAEERELAFLESVRQLRESELSLLEAADAENADREAKLRQIQDAIREQGEYLASVGGSQAEINALAADWLETEREIVELQAELEEKRTKAQEIQIERLESLVRLRQGELDLMDARNEAEADLIAKHRQIQDALREEALYLESIGAKQEDVNALAQQWWKLEGDILKIQQAQLDKKQDAAEEYLKEEEERRVTALEEQLDTLKEQRDAAKEQKEEEEKLLAVEKARIALENAQRQRSVRMYNAATGQWEWAARTKDVQSAQEALQKANENLEEYYAEREYKAAVAALEKERDYTKKAFDALRDALDYAAKKIKAGEMTFKEAYQYISGKMHEVYDKYSVDLGGVMDKAVDGFESVSAEIEGTWEKFHEVRGQLGDTVAGFGRVYSDLVYASDALEEAQSQLSLSAVTFGAVNTDLQRAEGALRSTADRLADLPESVRKVISGVESSAGQGAEAGAGNLRVQDVIDEMRANSLAWWGAGNSSLERQYEQANQRLGNQYGFTYSGGDWYNDGKLLYSLSDTEIRSALEQRLRKDPDNEFLQAKYRSLTGGYWGGYGTASTASSEAAWYGGGQSSAADWYGAAEPEPEQLWITGTGTASSSGAAEDGGSYVVGMGDLMQSSLGGGNGVISYSGNDLKQYLAGMTGSTAASSAVNNYGDSVETQYNVNLNGVSLSVREGTRDGDAIKQLISGIRNLSLYANERQ